MFLVIIQVQGQRESEMTGQEKAAIFPNEASISINETLICLDWFIDFCARKVVHSSSSTFSPDVLYQLKEEVAQNTRIKLWIALQERPIEHIKAYISRVAYHEYISIVRQNKSFVYMLTNEEGEPLQDHVNIVSGEMPGDPASELGQSLAVEERMEMTADAVQSLHSRQQRAIICSLKERVDDAIHLKNALAARHIDVETIVWPDNKADKQLLKASISAARKNIAQFMSITLPCKVSTSSHCCI